MEAQGPRPDGTRRAVGILVLLPAVAALTALALGPVTWGHAPTFAAPGRVEVSPVGVPEPQPADAAATDPWAPVVAPSPTTAAEEKAYAHTNFAAPQIDIEPPPEISVSYTTFCRSATASASASSTSVTALLSAVNKERARLGYASLTWSSSLASDAQAYANTLRARSEANPSLTPGSSAWYSKVFKHTTSLQGANGENLAFQSGGSQSSAIGYAHRGWMASPGHCRNLLNP